MPYPDSAKTLTACLHPSGFARSDSNFDSLSMTHDGHLYYALCTHHIDTHGRIYRFDPAIGRPECLGDLGEIVGEAGTQTVPQGKSHSAYFEYGDRVYFATHYGFYKPSSNKEQPAETPPGYRPYPGGHWVAFHPRTGEFFPLAKAPDGEGFVAMTMDTRRGHLFGLTWPRGLFLHYEPATGIMHNLGPVCGGGEWADGDDYYCLCRSLAVHPPDGAVYFTRADGDLMRYDPGTKRVESTGVSLRREIFGAWDVHAPGHQGYNWRKAVWHPPTRRFYAVHPKSAFLLTFDPSSGRVDILDRIAADEVRRQGRFEPFRYGYLGLALGADLRTLYYLTGSYGVSAGDGRTVETAVHLVTYAIETGNRIDHGVVRLEDGRYPTRTQSLVVHPNGRIYTVPWIEKPDRTPDDPVAEQVELISFENPVQPAGL